MACILWHTNKNLQQKEYICIVNYVLAMKVLHGILKLLTKSPIEEWTEQILSFKVHFSSLWIQ